MLHPILYPLKYYILYFNRSPKVIHAILYPIKVHHHILYRLNLYIVEMLNYCSDPLPTPLGTIAATAYNKTVNSNITFTCDDRFQPASGIPPATRCIPFTHQNGIWQNVTSACIRKFRFLTIEDHSSYD